MKASTSSSEGMPPPVALAAEAGFTDGLAAGLVWAEDIPIKHTHTARYLSIGSFQNMFLYREKLVLCDRASFLAGGVQFQTLPFSAHIRQLAEIISSHTR